METLDQRLARKLEKKRRLIRVAAGQEEADLVIRNARFLNVFTSRWEQGDIAVAGGIQKVGSAEERNTSLPRYSHASHLAPFTPDAESDMTEEY